MSRTPGHRREADPEYFDLAKVRFMDGVRQALALSPFPPTMLIETGTLYADRTKMALDVFEFIWTIELSDEFHSMACMRFAEEHRVACLKGDSGEVLRRFIKCSSPLFFLLDAHPCFMGVDKKDRQHVATSFPLWKELETISQRRDVADIVWIDDRHNMNRTADWLERHSKAPEWVDVTYESLREAVSMRDIRKAERVNNAYVMVIK